MLAKAKVHKMHRKLAIVIFVSILLAYTVPADTVGADPGWNYYRDITIESDLVPSTQSNFPVLLSVSHNDFKHTGSGGSMGKTDATDIRFTDTGNNQLYDYEIEDYNSTTGALVIWVEIPSVDGSTDTSFRMWYGNADADDGQNVEGVWDSNFVMIQHLQETSGTHFDSTSNNNDSIAVTVATQGSATGKIDGTDEFDGVTANYDYVQVDDSDSLDLSSAGTVIAWINPDSISGYVLVKGTDSGENGRPYLLSLHNTNPWNTFYLGLADGGGLSKHYADDSGTTGDMVTGEWQQIGATWDGSDVRLYRNGALYETKSQGRTPFNSSNDLRIGAFSSTAIQVDGHIDEVRISNIKRDTDWITTSYNNQSDQAVGAGKFINSIGTQTAATGVDPVPELPTILLVSIGLVGLGIYLWLGKFRRVSA